MSTLREPSARRTHPIQLADVPLEERRAAALALARQKGEDVAALLDAAEDPSSAVYYVAPVKAAA